MLFLEIYPQTLGELDSLVVLALFIPLALPHELHITHILSWDTYLVVEMRFD